MKANEINSVQAQFQNGPPKVDKKDTSQAKDPHAGHAHSEKEDTVEFSTESKELLRQSKNIADANQEARVKEEDVDDLSKQLEEIRAKISFNQLREGGYLPNSIQSII